MLMVRTPPAAGPAPGRGAAIVVAAMLFLGASLAGCATPAPSQGAATTGAATWDRITIPTPRPGDMALYDGTRWTLDVRVGSVIQVRDVLGADVAALSVYVDAAGANGHLSFVEFYDAEWRRVLSASPCHGLGAPYRTPAWSCDAPRVSLTYLSSGLPGVAGASAFWGATLPPRDLVVPGAILGQDMTQSYRATPVVEEQRPCLQLDGERSHQRVSSWMFTVLTGAPASMTLCDGIPFPTAFALDGDTYALRSFTRGDGGIDVAARLGRAASLHELPADARLEPLSGEAPAGLTYDPTGFPPAEAIVHLRDQTVEGRAWLQAHPGAYLGSTYASHYSRATVGPTDVSQIRVTRELVLRAPDGARAEATLLRSCVQGVCADELLAWDTSASAAAAAARPPGAIDLRALLPEANETLGEVVSVLTWAGVINDPAPLALGDRYLHVFQARAADGGLFPPRIAFDALTGAMAAFFLPEAMARPLLGFDPDVLRSPPA